MNVQGKMMLAESYFIRMGFSSWKVFFEFFGFSASYYVTKAIRPFCSFN